MIKKYSQSLVEMGLIYGGEAEKKVVTPPKTENQPTLVKMVSSSDNTQNNENALETAAKTLKNTSIEIEDVDSEPVASPPRVDFTEGEATGEAGFIAAVFSAEEAYPVANARVVIYRGDNIYAFLTTDENGRTKAVRLPALAEENSLEADNPRRSIDYSADVFAEGFIPRRGLLVSAVGGSDILLKVIMIPEEERIS